MTPCIFVDRYICFGVICYHYVWGRWRQHVSPTFWYPSTNVNCVTSHQTVSFLREDLKFHIRSYFVKFTKVRIFYAVFKTYTEELNGVVMPSFHSGHEGDACDEIILHATYSSGLKNKVAFRCNSETIRHFFDDSSTLISD
jgi:hypothetical protein